MSSCYDELLIRHISTHTVRSAEDRAAVSTLESFLTSDRKINTNFSCDDKWPNHDGTFEFVSKSLGFKSPMAHQEKTPQIQFVKGFAGFAF